MADPAQEQDAYELLGVGPESTDEQIRKAYRQTSLRVHPDKNPSPEASALFHALTQAYALLQDPLQRAALNASLLARRARASQLAAASSKKRALLEELEAAERAAKRSKTETAQEERRRREEEERIKLEGRMMRERKEREAEKLARRREAAAAAATGLGEEGAKVDPLELTLLLRLPHPPPSAADLLASLSKLGPLDASSLLFRPSKPPKPGKREKEKKGGTAVVQFLSKKGALAASQAGGRRDLGLEGVRIEWAAGEPEWVRKVLSETPKMPEQTTTSSTMPTTPTTMPSFGFDSAGLDYESVTLARMRKAERERLEREILEQEGGD